MTLRFLVVLCNFFFFYLCASCGGGPTLFTRAWLINNIIEKSAAL